MKKIFLLLLILFFISGLFAQTDLPVGKWRTHFSYQNGLKAAEADNKVYCLTESGLFYVSKTDSSINKLTKLDGLSDFDISTIGYDQLNKLLLVAYKNTTIDIVKDNSILQITEIFRKSVPGKKVIYDIFFYDNKAYLSCSFGIVVYDLKKMEVKETYSEIGTAGKQLEIYQTTINNGNIYAATPDGILKASLSSPNLLDFNAWTNIRPGKSKMIASLSKYVFGYTDGKFEKYDGSVWINVNSSLNDSIKSMAVCYHKLIVNSNMGIYLYDTNGSFIVQSAKYDNYTLMDNEGSLWHAVNLFSLAKSNNSGIQFFIPNGPTTNKCWDIASYDNSVWVVPGSVSENFTPAFIRGGMYTFRDNSWFNNLETTGKNFEAFNDLNCITVNPGNKHVFIGSFGQGVIEYFNDGIQQVYNAKNSSLSYALQGFDTNTIIVSGIALDNKSNLWVANRGAANQLSVKWAKDGKWTSFNLGSGVNRNVSKIITDDNYENNRKWILLQPDEGILVFDETQPPGQQFTKLMQGTGNGNLPTNSVYSMAKDLDGRIWVGTSEGVAVFYDPSSIFSGQDYDAQKVWVSDGDNSGYLLATETVTAIAVDGANNKWLGTKRGIWYVSDDGSKILFSFNTKNSPLPSDYIRSIGINDVTGEVFIATDKGMVSYRNVATKGDITHDKVYAYPNPVRPEYKGPITITGLLRDDNVKITDIAGNMVYEAKSEGGQLSWDGKSFSGQLVRTGVYLIFCSNAEGTDNFVAKVLIVR
jgi:hypothetical protein